MWLGTGQSRRITCCWTPNLPFVSSRRTIRTVERLRERSHLPFDRYWGFPIRCSTRRNASSPDESLDADVELIMSMENYMSDEDIAAALQELGLTPTGDREDNLISLLPYEKARRERGSSLSLDQPPNAAELPAKSPPEDEANISSAEGGMSGDTILSPEEPEEAAEDSLEARIRGELNALVKADIQQRLREFNMRTTGKKGALVDALVELYAAAARQGVTPEQYRTRQWAQEEADKSQPSTTPDYSQPLEEWTLIQLRQEVLNRDQQPKGNKADLIAFLRLNPPVSEPQKAVEAVTPPAPWAQDDQLDIKEKEALSERDRQKRELQKLTVSEILGLLKSRKIPIGMKKRKEDLIDRLLSAIYTTGFSAEPSPRSPNDFDGQQEIDRSDLLGMLERLVPGWTPEHLKEELEFLPVTKLREELQSMALSDEGSKAELLKRLESHRPSLWERLKELPREDAKLLMDRLGNFETDVEDQNLTAKLYLEIVDYPWFAAEPSRYQDQPLISLHGLEHPTERLKPFVVAVLTTLPPGPLGDQALRSTQTAVQHLSTTAGLEVAGRGVEVDVYLQDGDKAWKCSHTELYHPNSTNLLLTLHSHGSTFSGRQELLKELKNKAHLVLPILPEHDRSTLQMLDEAGIDYIGSSADSRHIASHKHRCRSRLAELGYPTFPQLHLGSQDLHGLTSEEAFKDLLQRLETWFSENSLDVDAAAVVAKPAVASAAIGVKLASGAEGTENAIASLAEEGFDEVVVEPLIRNAVEFSVLVLETQAGPVASLPLEVQVQDPHEIFLDAQIEITRFGTRVKGFTDEDALHAELWKKREAIVTSTPNMVLFDTAAKQEPTGRVRIRCPPRLQPDITMAVREAAAKAFVDLGLKDYALIEGFVQLPDMGPPKREKPEELEHYEPPNVHELAHRLRRNDNSDLVPPWDPPEEEQPSEQWLEAYHKMVDDPDFKDMGPYTDPEVAKNYHSHDVALRQVHAPDEQPRAVIAEEPPLPEEEEMTEEEEAEWLEGWTDYPTTQYIEDEEEVNLEQALYGEPSLIEDDDFSYTFDDEVYDEEDDDCDLMASIFDDNGEGESAAEAQPPVPYVDLIVGGGDDEGLDENLVVKLPNFEALSSSELCRQEGWTIFISDVNLAPSLDASGIVFQAASQSGLSHSSLLRELVANSCGRLGAEVPPLLPVDSSENFILGNPPLTESSPPWHELEPFDPADMYLPWYHDKFKLRDHPWIQEAFGQHDEDEADTEAPEQLAKKRRTRTKEKDPDAIELEGPLAKALAEEPEGDPSMDSEPEQSGAEYEEQDEGPPAQKIWILCGGTGSRADESLASGIHVYHEFLKHPDVLVELFLLAPPCSEAKELDRRKTLLEKHVQRIKITSNLEVDQPEELQIQNIRNPPVPDVNITERLVWAVPPHLLLHRSVAEVHQACEDAVSNGGVVFRHKQDWQKAEEPMRELVLDEMLAAGVDTAGFAWGLERELLTAKCCDMYEWSVRANVNQALVFNTLQSGLPETGQALALLDNMDTAYTGSSTLSAANCADKGQMAEVLASLDMHVIETPPKFQLTMARFLDCLEKPDRFAALLQNAKEQLGLQSRDPVCIRPGIGSGDAGVSRIDTAEDLMAYSEVLRDRLDAIPALALSWGNLELKMPRQPCPHYYLEPFTAANSLVIQETGTGSEPQVVWANPQRWMKASIGLLGKEGEMMAMTPSIAAYTPSRQLEWEYLDEGYEDANPAEELEEPSSLISVPGEAVWLCPPPSDIMASSLVTRVQEKAERVAQQLGLSGLASLQGYINADSGDLRVIDVDTSPPLQASSTIFAQAASDNPELTPIALFRRIAYIGLTRHKDPVMTQALKADVSPPDYDMEGEPCTYPGQENEPIIQLIEPVESMLRALNNQSPAILNFGTSPVGDVIE